MAHRSAQVRASKTAEVSADIRALCGREYLVIRTTALVEGVRHASGAEDPELVLASSFARHVETWNGRPIVVNHPVNAKGQAILASDPDVLDRAYLGKILNASLEVDRLVVESWIDLPAVAASTSQAVRDMWARLEAEETVEVSVGALVYTITESGEWNGKKYSGVWDIVIPDHLAFLDGDQVGACSVSDGCGTYRPLACGSIRLSKGVAMAAKGAMRRIAATEPATTVAAAGGCSCGKSTACQCEAGEEADDTADWLRGARAIARTLWASETFDMDRRTLLQRVVVERFGEGNYVASYNDKVVVFERYTSKGYKLFQVGYSSDAANNVALAKEDPVEVVFQVKTVEVSPSGKDKQMAKGKSKAKTKDCEDPDKENEPDPTDPGEDGEDEEEPAMGKSKGKGKGMAGTVSLDGIETLDGLEKALSGTPIGRDLSRALKVAKTIRERAITAILSSPAGKNFTNEMLAGVDFDVLDRMASSFKQASAAVEPVEEEPAEEEPAEAGYELGFMSYGGDDVVAAKGADGKIVEKGKKAAAPAGLAKGQNYAGRGAGGRAATGASGPPTAPNVFDFDASGKLKSTG